LSRALVDQLIHSGFDGAPPAGLAGRLFDFAGGHPQRTMQLSDAAWRLVEDRTADADVWGETIATVRLAVADGFELRFSGFSEAEQGVMRLAAGDGTLFGRDAGLLSLSASSAENARRTLIDRGQIEKVNGTKVHVIDPLFGDWLRHRFPF